MSAVKGSSEFSSMRAQHEQDLAALTSRLRALQTEVEAGEAAVSAQASDRTIACAKLPAVARNLAALALSLTEAGQQDAAAATFTHALALLEGAFGPGQAEIVAFHKEVQAVVAGSQGTGAVNKPTPQRGGRAPPKGLDDYDA